MLHLKFIVATLLISALSAAAPAQAETTPPRFKKVQALVDKKKISIELAETDAQHEHGLMFRKKLGSDEGMLFVFESEGIRTFWMKNTLIDLSIGYFDKSKKLIDIQEMIAMNSVLEKDVPTYPSKSPAMYALEMPTGWFKKNKIKEGAQLRYSR